jgi:hypothetical protein
VKAGDGVGFRGDRVGVLVVGVVLWRLGAEASAEGRGLLFQGVSRRALLVKGVGCGADVLLGVGGRLEESSILRKLLAALGVDGAQRGGLILQALGRLEGLIAELGCGSRDGGGGGGHVCAHVVAAGHPGTVGKRRGDGKHAHGKDSGSGCRRVRGKSRGGSCGVSGLAAEGRRARKTRCSGEALARDAAAAGGLRA